ncbi:MAG: shikimate dehydrogenase [Planctomycetales bacterium]|nr:shikimate dehydrogenase [Planctomycetales bacterium]NIM07733.1 shikimate dehydrogenase [Planctomycetales bacterium]NIN07232.1 shikimate dehydrogenase [Planctomycetales bacterium]NIN76325.1 shikimate dehydrogenase [Planctomycetales bacterium]NIO33532.1 shikimate dehydrogenase [Planctomycetales bacterium]
MLCVSIGRSRHRHMISAHRHLAEQGAQLVELRLDYIKGEIQLKSLLEQRPCPTVITCRREQDGGKYGRSEEARQALLRMAIAEQADYVDLEEDIAAGIPRYGSTKRIVSFHDFRQTPADLEDLHARMCQLDPDIVKVATMANSPLDNFRMLELIRNARVPTVGICMGEMGMVSRILAGRFGAPFSFATFHHERTLAPGQLSFEEMRDIYHYDQIQTDSTVYGVIADPIRQSLSPLIHNTAFHAKEINAVYVPLRVPREHLNEFLVRAPQIGIRGLSVTIPHKEAVVNRVQKADRVVLDIGAANTLIYEDDGLMAYNTDSRAAMDSLEAQMPADPDYLQDKTALVLGAGGAAKAIAYGLLRRKARVVISGRTPERAQQLADKLSCEAIPWNARYHVDCSVLVNCTPVGMHPDIDNSPYEKHHLKPSVVVFDTVYNPENTLLIKNARSQGCQVVTGVEMFVRQAVLQFNLFTGKSAPDELMRKVLKRATGAAQL